MGSRPPADGALLDLAVTTSQETAWLRGALAVQRQPGAARAGPRGRRPGWNGDGDRLLGAAGPATPLTVLVNETMAIHAAVHATATSVIFPFPRSPSTARTPLSSIAISQFGMTSASKPLTVKALPAQRSAGDDITAKEEQTAGS